MGTIPWMWWGVPCWLRNRPWSMTCRRRSVRRRRGSSDSPPMRCSGSQCPLIRRRVFGRRTYRPRPCVVVGVLEVAGLVDHELVVRPERVVEGEVAMLFGSVGVEQPRHVAHHVHAQPAVQRLLALVKRTDTHAYLHAHSNYNTSWSPLRTSQLTPPTHPAPVLPSSCRHWGSQQFWNIIDPQHE